MTYIFALDLNANLNQSQSCGKSRQLTQLSDEAALFSKIHLPMKYHCAMTCIFLALGLNGKVPMSLMAMMGRLKVKLLEHMQLYDFNNISVLS